MKSNSRFCAAWLLLVSISLGHGIAAAEFELNAEKLQSAAQLNGGLCLAFGLSPAYAGKVVQSCKTCVQLVAPDPYTAVKWLRTLKTAEERANILAVSHGTDPLPYAHDLANLIIVNGQPSPSLQELARVLAPGGTLALVGLPADFSANAGKYGLKPLAASELMLFQKPKLPPGEDWSSRFGSPQMGNSAPYSTIEPTLGLRWRAGPRWNNRDSAYDGMICSDGVFVYREINLVPGQTDQYQRVLVGRDAFNGRELWRVAEAPIPHPRFGGFSSSTIMTAGEGSLLMDVDNKPTCISIHTGSIKYVLARPGNEVVTFAHIYQHYLICAGGRSLLTVHELQDGHLLWSSPLSPHSMAAVRGDTVFGVVEEKGNSFITAWDLDKGTVRWKHPAAEDEAPAEAACSNYAFCSGGGVHYAKYNRAHQYLMSLDFKTGKKQWMAEIDCPLTVFPGGKDLSESLSMTALENEIWYQFKKGERIGYTVHMTCIEASTGKILKKNFSMHNGDTHCWKLKGAGSYLLYATNQFVNHSDMSVAVNGLARSICDIGHIPGSRELFMLPHNCRCGTLIRGIVAMGAPENEIALNAQPLRAEFKSAQYAPAEDSPADWPMYRHDPIRSNASLSAGKNLKEVWQADLGSPELSQAVSAYGMVFVSDSREQRIVALDAETGAQKWSFPTGSRIQYAPSLYKGVCLAATNSGWVFGIDARTGTPLWKLLVSPAERYIGGQDRFESLWPTKGDVLVLDGVAYANAGHGGTVDHGIAVVAFDPLTGKPVWNKNFQGYGGTDLLVSIPGDKKHLLMNGHDLSIDTQSLGDKNLKPAGCLHQSPSFGQVFASLDDYLQCTERNKTHERRERLGNGKVIGLYVSFSDAFSLCVENAKPQPTGKETTPRPQDFQLFATKDGKNKLWEIPNLQMRVDGMVVGSEAIYCAGHSLVDDPAADSTLTILAPETGAQLQTIKIKDVPVFDGLSAARGKVFLVTKGGRVICYQ